MNKIIQLSEYGFKLDQNPDKWISCDKKFIQSVMFKSLKVGDIIASMSTNDKNFVTGLSRVSLGSDRQEGSSSTPQINSNIVPSSVQDNIRYAQCVNIAFNNFNGSNLEYQDRENHNLFIIKAFDLADKIYEEFNKRCSR